MKTAIFISRHEPTARQVELAEKAGFELTPIGDLDAFAGLETDRELNVLLDGGARVFVVANVALAMRITSMPNRALRMTAPACQIALRAKS